VISSNRFAGKSIHDQTTGPTCSLDHSKDSPLPCSSSRYVSVYCVEPLRVISFRILICVVISSHRWLIATLENGVLLCSGKVKLPLLHLKESALVQLPEI
jgi:hypothetical protein